MNKHYLQLEFSTGLFFIYSKDEKQGYEKHTSSKGNVSYRFYYKDGVSGILESASIYEGKFGNQISLNIKNGDDVYYLPVDIADQKGNVDSYAESLIKFLPQLQKGMSLSVRGYNFTPEGDKYSKIGISFSVNGEKLKSTLTNGYMNKEGVLVPGDIPAVIWKKDALGKNKPTAVSLEAKNDYLLSLLKTETERLKYTPTTSQPQTVQHTNSAPVTPQQAFAQPTHFPMAEEHQEGNFDPLPF